MQKAKPPQEFSLLTDLSWLGKVWFDWKLCSTFLLSVSHYLGSDPLRAGQVSVGGRHLKSKVLKIAMLLCILALCQILFRSQFNPQSNWPCVKCINKIKNKIKSKAVDSHAISMINLSRFNTNYSEFWHINKKKGREWFLSNLNCMCERMDAFPKSSHTWMTPIRNFKNKETKVLAVSHMGIWSFKEKRILKKKTMAKPPKALSFSWFIKMEYGPLPFWL